MKSREYWDSNFEERYKVRKTKWPKLPLKVSPDQGQHAQCICSVLRWAGQHCSWSAVVRGPQYTLHAISLWHEAFGLSSFLWMAQHRVHKASDSGRRLVGHTLHRTRTAVTCSVPSRLPDQFFHSFSRSLSQRLLALRRSLVRTVWLLIILPPDHPLNIGNRAEWTQRECTLCAAWRNSDIKANVRYSSFLRGDFSSCDIQGLGSY
jgi:hypothetical protein